LSKKRSDVVSSTRHYCLSAINNAIIVNDCEGASNIGSIVVYLTYRWHTASTYITFIWEKPQEQKIIKVNGNPRNPTTRNLFCLRLWFSKNNNVFV